MMPYEDAEFWNMELAEPEAEIPDQDDAPTLEEGDQYVGMEVFIPRRDVYQRETVAYIKRRSDGELIGH